MIDRLLEIVDLAIDPHKHFIHMPTPLRMGASKNRPLLSDIGNKDWPKAIPPGSNCPMADVDPALSKRKQETDVHHHCKADDLGRGLEISKGIRHPMTLSSTIHQLMPISSDNALERVMLMLRSS